MAFAFAGDAHAIRSKDKFMVKSMYAEAKVKQKSFMELALKHGEGARILSEDGPDYKEAFKRFKYFQDYFEQAMEKYEDALEWYERRGASYKDGARFMSWEMKKLQALQTQLESTPLGRRIITGKAENPFQSDG